MTGYEKVYARLDELGLLVPSWGAGASAHCPGPLHHREDRRPSLSLSEAEDGRALIYCHTGCEIRDITKALELTPEDYLNDREDGQVVARYVYTDEEGNPLIRVNRTADKRFWQEHWGPRIGPGTIIHVDPNTNEPLPLEDQWVAGLNGVRRVLYHLPLLVAAVKSGVTVYIVEGEKDVKSLEEQGCVATTKLGGASAKWMPEWSTLFTGADVIIIADNDEPGMKSALQIKEALDGTAGSVSIRRAAVGKDVTDHLAEGFDLSELLDEDSSEEFGPVDWLTYQAGEESWLMKPYIPAGGRVLLYGKTGSLKSLWAMWAGATLAKQGLRVAYFSLEMRPSQSVARLQKLAPPASNFRLYTKLQLENPYHQDLMAKQLHGYDLIIVDPWNVAIKDSRYDQDVANLDAEVFQPLIDRTGATLMLIDNTGHDVITDAGKVKMDRARGSSAKADKMDITLWMDRPFQDDNYTADLYVRKMRYDFPMPSPLRIRTPQNGIDFFIVDSQGGQGTPMLEASWDRAGGEAISVAADDIETPPSASIEEILALARVKDVFGVKET